MNIIKRGKLYVKNIIGKENLEFVNHAKNYMSAEFFTKALSFISVPIFTRLLTPDELAQDTSPKIPSIRYSLEQKEKKNNIKYDFIIDLDITSPFRKKEDIEKALNKAKNKEVDGVFSVVESRRSPLF